jgi:hypothetical protein
VEFTEQILDPAQLTIKARPTQERQSRQLPVSPGPEAQPITTPAASESGNSDRELTAGECLLLWSVLHQLTGFRHPCTAKAFAAEHMPELDHEINDFQVFKWRLTNWKNLDKKLLSDQFECGGHKW